ncbi:MAG TPA: TorF family putative porin, partial [Caldimonas sp.]
MALQAALAVLLLGLAGSACSQTAVSLKVESDFIFRGVSRSGGRPDASLSVDWDSASGGYAGGSATTVEFDAGRRQAALFAYIGYVRRAESGLAWEVGATGAAFGADSRYDYGEVFVGAITRSWTARVYLS